LDDIKLDAAKLFDLGGQIALFTGEPVAVSASALLSASPIAALT